MNSLHLIVAVLLALTFASGNTRAADSQAERLSSATEQYAKCLDNTLGNFAKDEEAQIAAKRISAAMLRNIRALLVEERKRSDSKSRFWIETLGEEAFVGYLFKSFSDVSEEYRTERQNLKTKNNSDWRKTQQHLWGKYGCDAIYSQLVR